MANQGPLSGKLVANRYRLGELLGSGGMGAVYKAQDTRLSRPVAIKVMSPTSPISAADLQHFTKLFQTEALRLASLKHASIPHIYDHFEENANWFLAMELIEGETLNAYLQRQGGRLPVEEVLKIGIQLADVLHYLHQYQPPIIFRDLKPANIMISTNGQIFLIDFGIARVFTPGKIQDTFVFLSPGYAAPEQHGTAQTTVRSDIYSLGATLHHLLSGTHPATSPFLFAPLPIQQPTQLASLIAQMVALDPANRPPSMAGVKDALQSMIDQTDVSGLSTSAILLSSTPVLPPVFSATPPAQPAMGATPVAIDTPTRGTTLAIHKQSIRKGATLDFEYRVNALAWSPDGQRIASASLSGIDIWDTITGKTLKQLNDGAADAIVWSPNGKYIVASCGVGYDDRSNSHTRIWEANGSFWNRKQWEASYHYSDAPSMILWSPDSSKVAIVGSPDFNPLELGVGIVSLRDHKLICRGRPCNSDAIAWSPDSTRIAWGAGNEIPVWDVSSSQREGHHLLTYREHRSAIVAVSWSSDGIHITSTSEDGRGLTWEAGSGDKVATFSAPIEKKRTRVPPIYTPIHTIEEKSTISPDGTLTAVPTDNGIEIRTVVRGETIFVYHDHFSDKTAEHWSAEVLALSWSPDGTRIAFARFDGKIYVWQAV